MFDKLPKNYQDILSSKEFNKTDHRYISDDLLNAFCKQNGALYAFKKFVDSYNKGRSSHERILVLLRGNDDKITIYLNNHVIWDIAKSKNNFKVSFNFDHARYYKGWKQELENLLKLGFKRSKKSLPKNKLNNNEYVLKKFNSDKENPKVNGGTIGYIVCTKTSFNQEFVQDSFNIIAKCVESFFDNPDKTDYFRDLVEEECGPLGCKAGSGVGPLVEKRWQQRLYWQFKNLEDGYYVYDLEFAQKFPNKDIREEVHDKYDTNEPDMLAIRFENGIPKALVLMEVKSTKSACEGKSGIIEHIKGMKEYIAPEVAQFIANRRVDAEKLLSQFKDLGYIGKDISIPGDLPVELVLILTNANLPEKKTEQNAITYYEAHKTDIDDFARIKNCEIWIINGNYFDDSLSFEKLI